MVGKKGSGNYSHDYKSAIIDVGLDENAYRAYTGFTHFFVVSEGYVHGFDKPDMLGLISHGGQCLEHYELGAGYPVDVFILLMHDEQGRCNVDDLITSLDWCKREGIALISLSMGTTQYSDARKIAESIRRIGESGICLIAGANNGRLLSFPACLPECIGVGVDYSQTLSENSFAVVENAYDGIDVYLSPNIHEGRLIDSTSMATAYFAGLTSKAISNGDASTGSVKKWLSSYKRDIQATELFSYLNATVIKEYEEDILFVAVQGLSSNESTYADSLKMQRYFLDAEYLCAIVHPDDSLIRETSFERFEFKRPCSIQCDYASYVKLIVQLCHPSLVLIDSTNIKGELGMVAHALFDKVRSDDSAVLLNVDYSLHAPYEAFSKIVEVYAK